MAATQEALPRADDVELRESQPAWHDDGQAQHVHGLQLHRGPLTPQVVRMLLEDVVPPRGRVLDPFAGSGTTLVQALESGCDATGVADAGVDALLARVKTRPYNLDAVRRDLLWAYAEMETFVPSGRYPGEASAFVRACYAPTAAEELLHFRSLVDHVGSADVLRVVLARSARALVPAQEARTSLLRDTLDTLERIEAFAALRRVGCVARMIHGDARVVRLHARYDAVVTAPPYPGGAWADAQRRCACELIGLREQPELDLGRAIRATGAAATADYVDAVASVLRNARSSLVLGGRVCIVVDDRRDLYPEILQRAGLQLVDRRHGPGPVGRSADGSRPGTGAARESVLVAVAR